MSRLTLLLALTALLTTVTAAQSDEKIHIEHRPGSSAVNARLADAWLSRHMGELPVAQLQYRDVLRQEAHNRDALLGLAAIALRQQDDHLATNYFAQALILDPRDPIAHAGLALISGEVNTESSLKLLREQHPDSAALHFALGKLYGEQARWNEARAAFERSHLLAPDEAAPLLDLAICLDHLNQARAAAATYQRALESDRFGHTFDHEAITQRLQQLDFKRYDSR